jgi:hypothetical protein
MSDAAVKRMIKLAKQRGYVTYDELNDVLPSEEVSSEQIEDTMAMLTEMGINVVESEGDTEEWPRRPSVRACRSRWRRPPSRSTAPTIRCACTCARWARSSCCRAKARSPSPSASRPAARR